MRPFAYLIVFYALAFSTNASACEQWKSEIASLAWQLGGYIKAFTKYSGGSAEVMHHQLSDKSREVATKMKKLQSYVSSTASCDDMDGKYERRRNLLLNTIRTALPIVSNGKYLAPAIKDALDRESK